MNYRVNDIFYSLQGEGRNTGRAAVFVRFAGCNLRCPFCDTRFDTYREYDADALLRSVSRAHAAVAPGAPLPMIVLTGGEPTLQVDDALVDQLHAHGYYVAMESNGTRPAPRRLDWLTVSPKRAEWGRAKAEDSRLGGERKMPDEIKIVFDEHTEPETMLPSALAPHEPSRPLLYLQPCDTGDAQRNAAIVQRCVDYIKCHPQWRLSLQTHKLINIE